MRIRWMISGLAATVAAGTALELTSAEMPEAWDSVLALATGGVLMILVTIESVALSPERGWVRTLLTGVKAGALTGGALVFGLYLPWTLSIGDRDPTRFSPVREWYLGADLLLMAWGAVYGAVLGAPCGMAALVIKSRMGRRPEKRGYAT